jgi:hypothetical protein
MLFLDFKSNVNCFNVPSTIQRQQQPIVHCPRWRKLDLNRKSTSLSMMTSADQAHEVLAAASLMHGFDMSHLLTSSSSVLLPTSAATATTTTHGSEITQWIADAASAAAATDKADDGGWWKAYINVFKSILSFVHSTVEGPLRSVGIEQSWGISIFLFTASK